MVNAELYRGELESSSMIVRLSYLVAAHQKVLKCWQAEFSFEVKNTTGCSYGLCLALRHGKTLDLRLNMFRTNTTNGV